MVNIHCVNVKPYANLQSRIFQFYIYRLLQLFSEVDSCYQQT